MRGKVSFITVNFNQPEVTVELLKSLEKLNYRNFETIVVDNGSDVNHENYLKEKFPEIIYIRSEENLGFAGGNNLALSKAKGDLLFFINNDTEVTETMLEPLIDTLCSRSDYGAICPKIMYFDKPEMIQFAGYTKINPFTGRNSIIGEKELDKGQFDNVAETPYAHGAAMMLKKEVIEKIGPMPEEFFLYYEELDWSEKIRRAGYKIIYEPKSKIYHKESVSTGKVSGFKLYYLTRNRILFCVRNFNPVNRLYFLLFFMFISIPKNVLIYFLKGQKDNLKAFIKGVKWHLTKRKTAKL